MKPLGPQRGWWPNSRIRSSNCDHESDHVRFALPGFQSIAPRLILTTTETVPVLLHDDLDVHVADGQLVVDLQPD